MPDSPHKIFIGGLPNYLNEEQVGFSGPGQQSSALGSVVLISHLFASCFFFFFCGSLGGGHLHRLILHPQVELFEREQRRLKEVQSRVEHAARAKFLFFQLVASSREKCKARQKNTVLFQGFLFSALTFQAL